MHRIITIAASYGAGGSIVAPAVAEALGIRFLDRALHRQGTSALDEAAALLARGEAATEEERTGGRWTRIFEAFARMPSDPNESGAVPVVVVGADDRLREQAEARLREFVEGGDGVVLGWASSVVIGGAYHVRLDGPLEERLRQGMAIGDERDEAAARRQLAETDRVRSQYWRRLYRRDWDDLTPYHLVIDSTAIELDVVTDLIVTAARAHWRR